MTRDELFAWIERYEQLWRTAGTHRLDELFTDDVVYVTSPWATPIHGLDALAAMWESERDGAGEGFTMDVQELIAVDGDTGVAQVEVDYAKGDRWRDLWIVRLDAEQRCTHFEEWPIAPGQSDGHGQH